jgi:hypothetical protein
MTDMHDRHSDLVLVEKNECKTKHGLKPCSALGLGPITTSLTVSISCCGRVKCLICKAAGRAQCRLFPATKDVCITGLSGIYNIIETHWNVVSRTSGRCHSRAHVQHGL